MPELTDPVRLISVSSSDMTDAELDFFFAVAMHGPNVDFDPDAIRGHVFDAIVAFFAARGV